MNKCITTDLRCIYYHPIEEKNKKPSYRMVCDMREGEEIKNIPQEEINNCKHYKTFKEARLKI